jgi:hypothetical protein
MPVISAMQKGINRRIVVQVGQGIKATTYLKNNESKKA